MIDLQKEIAKFSNEHDIDLTYLWRGQNEEDVDNQFGSWKMEFYDILKAKPDDQCRKRRLQEIIKAILHWGGIYKFGEDRLNSYVDKINNRKFEIDESTLLSSWTKILAAYDPSSYCIYDSRVAIALRVIVPNYSWFLPPRRNMEVIRCLLEVNPNKETPKCSYEEYLKILPQAQKERAKCEKNLFMLGGAINIDMIEEINALRNCSKGIQKTNKICDVE